MANNFMACIVKTGGWMVYHKPSKNDMIACETREEVDAVITALDAYVSNFKNVPDGRLATWRYAAIKAKASAKVVEIKNVEENLREISGIETQIEK